MLAGLGLVSFVMLALETSTGLLESVRRPLESLVSPIYFMAESPYLAGDIASEIFSTRESLTETNTELRREILSLQHVSQQFIALKAENDRLRELLGSQGRVPHEVLVAELVGVVPGPNSHQIIIDKGADEGIYAGQAVVDADGLFGQVLTVAQFTSRVLLITDKDHAVPVQVNRNGVRSIAGGTGELDALVLENVPISADIIEGDLIETSGLGGRFPVGYPVGKVLSVIIEPTSAYAQVTVSPMAKLDRSRHVLVIFTEGEIDAAAIAVAQSDADAERGL